MIYNFILFLTLLKNNKLKKIKKKIKKIFYNNIILVGIISKLYNTQGTSIMKDITTGNNIVQQKDINWSKRTLG